MVLPACQMAIRIGFSSLVYQDEVTAPISLDYNFFLKKTMDNLLSVIPGKKGACLVMLVLYKYINWWAWFRYLQRGR
jgi:hypothetical protein